MEWRGEESRPRLGGALRWWGGGQHPARPATGEAVLRGCQGQAMSCPSPGPRRMLCPPAIARAELHVPPELGCSAHGYALRSRTACSVHQRRSSAQAASSTVSPGPGGVSPEPSRVLRPSESAKSPRPLRAPSGKDTSARADLSAPSAQRPPGPSCALQVAVDVVPSRTRQVEVALTESRKDPASRLREHHQGDRARRAQRLVAAARKAPTRAERRRHANPRKFARLAAHAIVAIPRRPTKGSRIWKPYCTERGRHD
jgi:hypothetical protein